MATEKVKSGIAVVDAAWDGLNRGDAYLVYGQPRSSRYLLTLEAARAATDTGETCALVSTRPADALAADAARIGFNLQRACARGLLHLVRPLTGDDTAGQPPLVSLRRLAGLGGDSPLDRLVVEDFGPLLQSPALSQVKAALQYLLRRLAGQRTTFVGGIGEPANAAGAALVAFLRAHTAGAVRLTPDPFGEGAGHRLSLLLAEAPPGSAVTVRWNPGQRLRPAAPLVVRRAPKAAGRARTTAAGSRRPQPAQQHAYASRAGAPPSMRRVRTGEYRPTEARTSEYRPAEVLTGEYRPRCAEADTAAGTATFVLPQTPPPQTPLPQTPPPQRPAPSAAATPTDDPLSGGWYVEGNVVASLPAR